MKMKKSNSKLLNKPGHHGVAAISWQLSTDDYGLDGTLSISDCSRAVHLDLSATSYDGDDIKSNYANVIYKVKVVRDEMDKILRLLESNQDELLRFWKEKKQERKRSQGEQS